MMFNFLMIGVVWSLKVSKTEETYDKCSQDAEDLEEKDRMQPWRVRAVCNEENSERLEEYLEVSKLETFSLEQEIDLEGKKKCGKRCRRNRAKRNGDKNALTGAELAPVGTRMYEGKFCGQSDPALTSGFPIANFSYKFNNTDPEFKIGKVCYNLDCTGRCDMVDPSVHFECEAMDGSEKTPATFTKLKATWFVTSSCKATDITPGNSADGEYTYTPEEVAMINSGSQDRFCFDASGVQGEQSVKNNEVQKDFNDYYYQYSAISTQKLPACPR